MGTEVWILGGTGRSGRAIAAELVSRGITPVLVGRDAARLAEAVRLTEASRQVEAARPDNPAKRGPWSPAPTDDLTAQIRQQQPAVVINTIGPFITTAPPIIQACLAASSDYLDLANDVAAVAALLAQNEAATAAGRTIVTGAGFGVTATESVVVKLTQQQPAHDRSSPPPPASGWTWCPPSRLRQARLAPPWPEPSWKACPVSTAVAVSRAGVTRTAAGPGPDRRRGVPPRPAGRFPGHDGGHAAR